MAEILAFFTVLKALGFDLAKIIEICFIIFVVLIGIAIIFWVSWKIFGKYVKAFFRSMKDAVEGAKAAAKSVEDLNNTLKNYMLKNDEKLLQGNQKFEEQSREIRLLARQIAAFAEQIRFLYTRMQIEPPKDGDHESQQTPKEG